MQSWIRVLPIDRPFCYEGDEGLEWVTVDKNMAASLVGNTNAAILLWKRLAQEKSITAYNPPILRGHKDDGNRFGDVIEVKVGSGYLFCLVDWLDATAEEIEANSARFVSVGLKFNWTDDTGRFWPSIIKEVSLTATPRLKDLGSIQDTLQLTLSEARSDYSEGEDKMEIEARMTALEELNAALLDRIAALEAAHAAMSAAAVEAELKAQEDKDEDKELEDKDKEEEKEKSMGLSEADITRLSSAVVSRLRDVRLGDGRPAQTPQPKFASPEAEAKAKGLVGDAFLKFVAAKLDR